MGLERKLRAIQDLKANHYIGTAQAWDYMKLTEALYENPRKVSDDINKAVSSRQRLVFPANPARIVLLGEFFQQAFDEIADSVQELNLDEDPYWEPGHSLSEKTDYRSEKLFHPLVNFEILLFPMVTYSCAQPERYSQYLIPIFQRTQVNDPTEEGLVNEVFEDLKQNDLLHPVELEKLPLIISKTDFSRFFTEGALRNYEKMMGMSIQIGTLKLKDRFERMERDRIDHRLENRRELVTEYVDSRLAQVGELSFEEIVDELKKVIGKDQLKLDIYAAFISPVGPSRTLHFQKALLGFLNSDRNFVRRYLKN